MDIATDSDWARGEIGRLNALIDALITATPPPPPALVGSDPDEPAPPPVTPVTYAAYVMAPPPSWGPARSPSPGPPPYLARKQPRRRYGDSTPGQFPRVTAPRAVQSVSLERAIEAMLDAHALDWAATQRRNCRAYLLSPSGRFQQWCRVMGIVSMAELTTERVADFLAAMLDTTSGPGLRAATVAKFRGHLRSLARVQATTPGFGDGLSDIDRIPRRGCRGKSSRRRSPRNRRSEFSLYARVPAIG